MIAPSAASAVEPGRAGTDVRALVKLGPRVAGTKVMDRASTYLIEQYRKAGYVAEVQTFTYPKFEDLGSSLTVDGTTIKGQALNGSRSLKPTAPRRPATRRRDGLVGPPRRPHPRAPRPRR